MFQGNKVKFALLMNQNSYSGREYLSALKNCGIKLDVIQIGKHPEYDLLEEERCGGKWKPNKVSNFMDFFDFFYFDSLNEFEKENSFDSKYDIAIQGGTGILNQRHIDKFNIGILNFHPGDLPLYRGCSTPEWQLIDKRDVICTCHLIDKGIDSGPIYKKKILELDLSDYHSFRSTVYPEIARFQAEVVKEIIYNNSLVYPLVEQQELDAVFRPLICDKKLKLLKSKFPLDN